MVQLAPAVVALDRECALGGQPLASPPTVFRRTGEFEQPHSSRPKGKIIMQQVRVIGSVQLYLLSTEPLGEWTTWFYFATLASQDDRCWKGYPQRSLGIVSKIFIYHPTVGGPHNELFNLKKKKKEKGRERGGEGDASQRKVVWGSWTNTLSSTSSFGHLSIRRNSWSIRRHSTYQAMPKYQRRKTRSDILSEETIQKKTGPVTAAWLLCRYFLHSGLINGFCAPSDIDRVHSPMWNSTCGMRALSHPFALVRTTLSNWNRSLQGCTSSNKAWHVAGLCCQKTKRRDL